jgi:predicted nucleic acid-binding Zn ribbon protein
VERLGKDVTRELGRLGGGQAVEMTRIVQVWPQAVGETIARNAWPARLARDGTLHVAASSAAWAFELAHLEREVLDGLRRAAGDAAPDALRFAVGRIPEPGAQEGVSESSPRRTGPTPEHQAEAALLTSGIEDEELRKLVAKAAAASLFRAFSDRSF